MGELFNRLDIDKNTAAVNKLCASSIISNNEGTLQLRSKTCNLLDNLVGKIIPGNIIEFCTAGEFSVHQLLHYLLLQAGPSNIYLSTWTIKEEPARVLFSLKREGLIKNIYCVLDYRVRTLDAKHFDFIKKIMTDHKLTKCHAKTISIDGERLSLSIVSSANLSNNPRIETGYINCTERSMLFHKGWIMDVINGKKVY